MPHYQAGSHLKAARFLVRRVFIFFQEFGREYISQHEQFNIKRFNNHFYICQGVYFHKVAIPKKKQEEKLFKFFNICSRTSNISFIHQRSSMAGCATSVCCAYIHICYLLKAWTGNSNPMDCLLPTSIGPCTSPPLRISPCKTHQICGTSKNCKEHTSADLCGVSYQIALHNRIVIEHTSTQVPF